MKKEGESVDFTDCKIYAEVRMTNVSGEKVNNRAQDYYKMLLFLNESTNDTFLLWDMERDIVYFSRQLTVLIGQEYKDGVPDDIFAYKLEIIKDIVYRNDMPKVERAIRHVTRGTDERMDLNFRYVDKHGKKFWVNCRGNVLNEGGKEQPLMIGCLSRRVLSEKVDMLTGLMNYNKMLENVEKGIAKGKRGHMLILGIDDFREINQCMGRDYGNQVLKTVAEVLEEIKNEKSSVYRMDGDHFGVDLAGCSKRETVDFSCIPIVCTTISASPAPTKKPPIIIQKRSKRYPNTQFRIPNTSITAKIAIVKRFTKSESRRFPVIFTTPLNTSVISPIL